MKMKFFVNENCIACGMCVGMCPEVFHMADSGLAEAIEEEVREDLESTALTAQEACPVNAIEIK